MTAPARDYGGRERQCAGKVPHFTRALAKAVAKKTKRHPGQRAARMKVYQCPWCGLWHVAHATRDREVSDAR